MQAAELGGGGAARASSAVGGWTAGYCLPVFLSAGTVLAGAGCGAGALVGVGALVGAGLVVAVLVLEAVLAGCTGLAVPGWYTFCSRGGQAGGQRAPARKLQGTAQLACRWWAPPPLALAPPRAW